MSGSERVFVGLGANLGDPATTLRAALQRLSQLPLTSLVARSGLYRSAPIDAAGPDYINAVAELRSELSPEDLLRELLALELAFGRRRPYQHAPRTLDLDLLLYGQRRIDSAMLKLPHPRMAQRAFVLGPLAELVPAWPLDDGRSVAEALADLPEQVIEKVGA